MFRDVIGETALTTHYASEYFHGKIYGDVVKGDNSFVSTLRALLYGRIPKEDSLEFSYTRSCLDSEFYENSRIDGASRVRGTTCFYDEEDIPGCKIFYCRFESSVREDNEKALECMEKYFTSAYSGFQRIQKITDFFVRRTKIVCFVNPELKTVFLFSGPINMRLYHYLQCSTYAMLPWYFSADDRPTDKELAVIVSLREESSEPYRLAIKNIADDLNFRGMRIRNLLGGFESASYRSELDAIAIDVEDCRNKIENLFARAREYQSKKRELETKSFGLMARIADAAKESEYMEYFLSNECLELIGCDGATVRIVARGYITFFDEETARTMIENESGTMYHPCGDYLDRYCSTENMKKLLTAVFLDKKIRMRVCAFYKLTRDGVYTVAHYNYGDDFLDCTPNPHIDLYRCLGDYEEAINTLLSEGDYIGATEQCIASCQSLNFADYYVMSGFAKRMYGVDCVNMRCFELPNGEVTDRDGAIAWLKDVEQKREAERTSEENEQEE